MGAVNQTLIEELVAMGLPRERAASVASSIEQSLDDRYSLHSQILATKRDLADLDVKLIREMAQHSERMAAQFALVNDRISHTNERISQTNERISQTNILIADTKVDLLKFMIGAFIANAGLMLGAIKYLR